MNIAGQNSPSERRGSSFRRNGRTKETFTNSSEQKWAIQDFPKCSASSCCHQLYVGLRPKLETDFCELPLSRRYKISFKAPTPLLCTQNYANQEQRSCILVRQAEEEEKRMVRSIQRVAYVSTINTLTATRCFYYLQIL